MSVGALLPARACIAPGDVALTDGSRALTYCALDDRVARLAGGLARRGLVAGDRVVVRAGNRGEILELLFACARLGLVLVPVGEHAAPDELRFVVEDTAAALVVADDAPVASVGLGAPYEALLAGPPATGCAAATADTPLLILHTSGTTGRPKGAVLTHGNILATSLNQLLDWGVRRDDAVLAVAPLTHAGGLLALTFPCLHAGGTVHVAPAADRGTVLAAVARHRITALFLPPRLWDEIADDPGLEGRDLRSVRLCATGGAPVRPDRARRIMDAFGAPFTNAYGLTEAASCSTILEGADVLEHPESVGRPFVHNELRVVDEGGLDVPAETIGEIVLRGPTVMREYWRRPAATAEALRGGWLQTGDLGRLDPGGRLTLAGRRKDLIVAGGRKVFPAEVERVLEAHPAVAGAAVVGIPDATGDERVVAVLEAQPGAAIASADVLAHCGPLLGRDKHPAQVLVLDALPRNASGKVLKGALRERVAALGAAEVLR